MHKDSAGKHISETGCVSEKRDYRMMESLAKKNESVSKLPLTRLILQMEHRWVD